MSHAQILLASGDAAGAAQSYERALEVRLPLLGPAHPGIAEIEVPLAAFESPLRAYKISKRFDIDISAVFVAARVRLEHDTVRDVRFVFGGMAAVVKRAAAAERAVLGHAWNDATVARASAALAQDFKPLTDLRASAGYRLTVAGNLLRRFWLETRTRDALPPHAVTVWAREPVA